MPTLLELIAHATRVEHRLAFAEKYFAHKPAIAGSKSKETLAEHMDLVLRYFERLCLVHKLDEQVDELLKNIGLPSEAMQDFWKKLFVETVAFHDFGKTNEHYQQRKMDNHVHFPTAPRVPFFPPQGHSELGAFIFIVHFFEEIHRTPFSTLEKEWAFMGVLFFSNSIMLHHSGRMTLPPIEKLEKAALFNKLDEILRFLEKYSFVEPRVAQKYFQKIEHYKLAFSEKPVLEPFALWAILRLNFSLLTASDYIATGEYMNDLEIKDFGILNQEQRERIIRNVQKTEKYNENAFEFANQPNFSTNHPTEPTGDNLNILRTEMAVEVIQNVRANSTSNFYYLEAPTGGGKTNLSMLAVAELLRLDETLNKVFYVFPFTTLITQTHQVILDTLGLTENEVALMHGKAGFQQKKGTKTDGNEDDTEIDADYGNEKRDFMENQFALYPFCLLTHIRFFDILKSNGKDAIYLMHRMANSIVVIDELQSYNPSEWDRMLWHIAHYGRFFNMRFLLMSATLPKIDELNIGLTNRPTFIRLLSEPLRFFQNPNFSGRIDFDFELLEDNRVVELTELAVFLFEKSINYATEFGNGSAHIIIEFIFKKAASTFQELVETMENESEFRFFDEIFVLSGTILEPRRREVIYFLKKKENRKKRILVISTQVVEAGVDIDMDLGFKNISLLDSDEQLAGRVNRNVNKEGCKVFLFKFNEASTIYGKDERFKVMRDELSMEERQAILEEKDFKKMYQKVFARIDNRNDDAKIIGAEKDFKNYREAAAMLDSKFLNEKFKLIDNDNFSVFVPLNLPVVIEGKNGLEPVFSEGERSFLKKHLIFSENDAFVSGRAVWELYRTLKGQPKDHSRFVERSVEDKKIQGILSKFTFSLFNNAKTKLALQSFCGEDDLDEDKQKNFEDYLYLRHWSKIYDYKTGLSTKELDNPDHQML